MNDGNTGYPWSQGDPLLAADLNAAIAAASSAIAAGGPFLPIAGGVMTGALSLAGNATQPLHAVPLQQLTSAVTIPVPAGGSIQAALDALPSTGGTVVLAANTVYVVTALITTTKPNVRVTASSWSTILRRDPGYSSASLLSLMGAGSVMEGFTIDGNSVVGTQFECSVGGANCLVRNMQIINGNGTGHLNLSGQNSRATGNTITGLGTSPSTQRGYGIWAISHATVLIDNNTITGTGIDGIGFDGQGTRVIGNTVSNCHCWTGGQGGQIASYNATLGGVGNSSVILDNTVGAPGSNQGSGIESWTAGTVLSGNAIDGCLQAAITVFGKGTTVTGNSIRNCGGSADAIVVYTNITDFVISGNRIADDQATPTMRYGISIYAGSSDRYTIASNLISGNTGIAVFDGGTGTNKTISNNQGNNDAALTAAGGTINGNLTVVGNSTIGNGSGAAALRFAGAPGAGVTRGLQIYTGTVASGVGLRWQFIATGATEPGANVGTDIGLFSYADNGAFIGSPMSIARATGLMTLNNGLSFGTNLAASTTDLSKQIALAGTTNGFSVTSGRLNYVAGATAAHSFVVGSTDVASIASGGMRVIGNVGFYNTAPVAKPTVSGAKGSNAALGSLIAALVAQGLIADTTTA